MIDLILGPIWQYVAGAAGFAALIFGAWWKGRRDERARRDAREAREYRDERQRIDDLDLGHGASDADRIRRLLDIERRGGSGQA